MIKKDITMVLAVYNNLDYTTNFYKHVRVLYPDVPLIISDGGSDDGTKQWLKNLNDINLKYISIPNQISFSENYNNAINLVETKKLVLVHNDMILGEGFLEELSLLINKDTLISYTTIEPPVFIEHKRPGKVIQDFGRDFNDFKLKEFNEYVNISVDRQLSEGISFFMAGYKSSFNEIGGFDYKTFTPYFCEDDDIILRFKLNGKKLITTNKALCYHFVSKTSRKNDSRSIEENSNKNFIRKWGFRNSINSVKYDIGIICWGGYQLVEALEPWCSNIFVKDDKRLIVPLYINKEQPNTSFNLNERVKYINEDTPNNKILIYIDQKTFTQEDYQIIQQLSDIIHDSGEIGKFNLGNMEVEIKQMDNYINDLICLKK